MMTLEELEIADGFSSKFAQEADYSQYIKRHPTVNKNSLILNTYGGKLGEFGTSFFVNNNSPYGLVLPDCKQYTKSEKNWNPDLPFLDFNIHVKTSIPSSFNPPSWTFQWANPGGALGGRDDLFLKPNSTKDIIFLVEVSKDPKLEMYIPKLVGWCTWKYAYPHLDDPVSNKLRGIKKCLYERDLETT